MGKNEAARSVPLSPTAFRAEIVVPGAPATLRPGETAAFEATVTNRGDAPWPHTGGPGTSFAVLLAYHWLGPDGSVVADGLRTDLPLDLAPGAHVTVRMKVRAPEAPGEYVLEPDMVQEAVAWFRERGSTAPRFRVLVK